MTAGLKDIARMSDALIQTAQRDLLDSNQVIARIEQNDAQRFLVQHAHFGAEKLIDELRRIDFLLR